MIYDRCDMHLVLLGIYLLFYLLGTNQIILFWQSSHVVSRQMQNVVFQAHTSQLPNACTIITSISIPQYITNYIKKITILTKKNYSSIYIYIYIYIYINILSVADLSLTGTCQRLTNPSKKQPNQFWPYPTAFFFFLQFLHAWKLFLRCVVLILWKS